MSPIPLAQADAVPTTLTRAQMEASVKAFLASYEAKDADSRIALFAVDPHFEDPVGAPPVRGTAALDKFFRDTIASGWNIAISADQLSSPAMRRCR